MFTIRNAEPADYEMVKVLEESVFTLHQQSRPDYFHAQVDYTRQEFEKLLALPAPVSLVAVSDGRIVALCFGKIEQNPENFFCKSRKTAFIEDLFTIPEYRGRGIASCLLQKAREMAIANNADSMELCVWAFNKDALRLYEKLGMKVQYYRMEERLCGGTN